jgi:hypothetical protein
MELDDQDLPVHVRVAFRVLFFRLKKEKLRFCSQSLVSAEVIPTDFQQHSITTPESKN